MKAESTYTAEEIRAAEAPLLAAHVPLMDRAAQGVASFVEEMEPTGMVLVMVGPGNNGGDGLFAAARMADAGLEVVVVPVAERWHTEGMARVLRTGVRVETDVDSLLAEKVPAVVVDAMVGIGATGGLRGGASRAVEKVMPLRGEFTTVAVDIPSGLDADTGEVDNSLVLPADFTVTFGALKTGMLRGEGPELCGEIVLVDIGLEPYLPERVVTR